MSHLVNRPEKGDVYDMETVWEKYIDVCESSDLEIPQMYISRRKSFYEQVQTAVGSKGRFVQTLSRRQVLVSK